MINEWHRGYRISTKSGPHVKHICTINYYFAFKQYFTVLLKSSTLIRLMEICPPRISCMAWVIQSMLKCNCPARPIYDHAWGKQSKHINHLNLIALKNSGTLFDGKFITLNREMSGLSIS